MYYINKIVGWVLSPLGMLFCGLAVCWLFAHVKWVKTAKVCLGLLLGFTWVLGSGVTTRLVGVTLEKEFTQPGRMHGSIEGLPKADAIVILGGGMAGHKVCGGAEMFSGADRVWVGARLYKAGHAPIVYCTGGGVGKSTLPLLRDFGVPEAAVRWYDEPRNTEEEAKKLAGENVKKILLVTSAWHMPRARMLFERVGFDVIPAPADFEMSYSAEEPFTIKELFPSSEGLSRNSFAVKEWVARVGYALLRR